MNTRKEELLPNYLRQHRKKTGFSQREVGILLGYADEGQVLRHERFQSLPPFVIAIAYEVIFREPVSGLFPGIRNRTEQEIARRIEALKESLEQQSGKSRQALLTARKLEWIAMRNGSK
jgi:hypothetical protein